MTVALAIVALVDDDASHKLLGHGALAAWTDECGLRVHLALDVKFVLTIPTDGPALVVTSRRFLVLTVVALLASEHLQLLI